MIFSTICATLWTLILIIDLIEWHCGQAPTWIDVFCPTLIAAIFYWEEVISKVIKDR